MRELSIGKYRHLQQCATPRGAFALLALDHRQNLRKALNPSSPASVSDADLVDFKRRAVAALAGASTAVLLDPEYGAAQSIASGALPGRVGLVVAVEATGYSGDATARRGEVLPGWSVAKVKRMGASAVKLLVYYHPDSPAAAAIESFVRQVAADCAAQDIPLFLEPLSYSLDPARVKLPTNELSRVVIETARRLVLPGVDVLKAEFPAAASDQSREGDWTEACEALTAASLAPWVLLSASVDFETYLQQVTAACQAGASGVAAGRAIWKEAVGLTGAARADFLQDTARSRMERLTAVCDALARPWTGLYAAAPVDSGWHAAYPDASGVA